MGMLWHMSTQSDNVARIVRTLLTHQNKSRGELARCLGVHVSAVSKALNGKRAWDIDDIILMADFFDVSPAIFFEDAETLLKRVVTGGYPSELVAA